MDVLTLNPSLLIAVPVAIVIGPPGVIGVEGARLEYQDKDGREHQMTHTPELLQMFD